MEDSLLEGLALAVEAVEKRGGLPGLRFVFRQKQVDGLLRRGDASGGVDAGDEAVGRLRRIDHLVIQGADRLERDQSDTPALRDQIEADACKNAIFVDQGGDIPDCPEGNQYPDNPEAR